MESIVCKTLFSSVLADIWCGYKNIGQINCLYTVLWPSNSFNWRSKIIWYATFQCVLQPEVQRKIVLN